MVQVENRSGSLLDWPEGHRGNTEHGYPDNCNGIKSIYPLLEVDVIWYTYLTNHHRSLENTFGSRMQKGVEKTKKSAEKDEYA